MGLADYESVNHVVLSLGAGVQSSAIAVMAYSEKDYGIPRPDSIYFADTGAEPTFVYQWLYELDKWVSDRGGDINIVSRGNLERDTIQRKENDEQFTPIPAWTEKDGDGTSRPLRRQCTREYKIHVIEQEIRDDLGYEKGQVMKGKVNVGVMLGISTDELTRASQNDRTSWTTNLFPLLDIGYSRSDCEKIFEQNGLRKPKKSSCYFCPYHDDQYWSDLKENHPKEFEKAVEFDEKIRDMSMAGVEEKIYLHRSCKPLSEVDFSESDEPSLFDESCGAFCGL